MSATEVLRRARQSSPKLVVTALLFAVLTSNTARDTQSQTVVPSPSPTPTPSIVTPSVEPTPIATEAGSPSLTFSTYNIAKPTNTEVPAWGKRRLAIARTINESSADVVGVEEATALWVVGDGGKRVRHWEDVQELVQKGGYKSATPQVNNCSYSSHCIHSAHVLFNTKTVKQVMLPDGLPSAGQGVLGDIAKGLKYAPRREFSWAYLQGLNGTGTFLTICLHLNNEKSAVGKADRALVGMKMTRWATELNKKSGLVGTPMILMGDFNSFEAREPRGMAYQLQKAGWTDSFDAAPDDLKFNYKAYTTSYTRSNMSGWPKKPIMSKNPVRIDYIMYRGKGLRADVYAVALNLKKDGSFDNNYRGSDHIMVQSVIHFDDAPGIASPTP
ncbi:MAG: endonuclease/exonuclease/phosphatase family protein [Actinomycetes bacterium]